MDNQKKYQRRPKYEFNLMLEPYDDSRDYSALKTALRDFVAHHNHRSNRIEIENMVIALENNVGSKRHYVYIHLNTSKMAADTYYFSGQSNLGCKILGDWGFKTTSSSIKDC